MKAKASLFDVRKAVATAELIAAVEEYQDFLLAFDDSDTDEQGHLDELQLAIARAFLRVAGVPADPWHLFDGLDVSVEAQEAARLDEQARRSAEQYRKSPIPTELRWAVFRRDNYTCRQCGLQEDLQADHVVPESKGGPTTMANLQTLCGGCNRKKGNRT